MFKTQTTLDRKDYFKMNVYYLRRFFGVREGILVALLLVGGFVLLFAFEQWIVAMLAGIAILIMIAAMIAYLVLADKGYREEYEKFFGDPDTCRLYHSEPVDYSGYYEERDAHKEILHRYRRADEQYFFDIHNQNISFRLK